MTEHHAPSDPRDMHQPGPWTWTRCCATTLLTPQPVGASARLAPSLNFIVRPMSRPAWTPARRSRSSQHAARCTSAGPRTSGHGPTNCLLAETTGATCSPCVCPPPDRDAPPHGGDRVRTRPRGAASGRSRGRAVRPGTRHGIGRCLRAECRSRGAHPAPAGSAAPSLRRRTRSRRPWHASVRTGSSSVVSRGSKSISAFRDGASGPPKGPTRMCCPRSSATSARIRRRRPFPRVGCRACRFILPIRC